MLKRLLVLIIILTVAAMPAFAVASRPAAPAYLWPSILSAAAAAGVDPRVIVAIEWQETGGYTSNLWKARNNPGGIKRRAPYSWLGRYATFPTPEEGIAAHGRVLSHKRYDAARRTTDVVKQVEAIADAGYAAYSETWRDAVSALARRVAPLE